MALIYIVEDDRSILEIEEFALKNSGYRVMGFQEAKSFYVALRNQVPDLVLLDIKHMAATPVGMKAEAIVTLVEIDGRRLVFAFSVEMSCFKNQTEFSFFKNNFVNEKAVFTEFNAICKSCVTDSFSLNNR